MGQNQTRMTGAISILIIIGAVYVSLCLIFYFFQDYFFFRPEILPKYFEYQYPFPFKEIDFQMEDGGEINALHFQVPNSRGVVFYLKGNSRSLKGWGKFAKDFVGKSYDFFMIDYRGFGKSQGKRTEKALFNDSQSVYKWLVQQYGEEQIILYGRSIGSGIAARLASWNNPKMLIMDSPYYSFLHHIKMYGFWMPVNWLLKYPIRTDRFVKMISCPIFIIHGRKDRLIPYFNSQKLQKAAPERVTLVPLDGAHHNNLPSFPEYHEYLYDILNEEELPIGVVEELGDNGSMVA